MMMAAPCINLLVCVCLVVVVVVVFGGAADSDSYDLIQVQDTIVMRPPSGLQSGEHFGFSLTHFTDATRQRWLLVGAPQSSVSKPEVRQSGGVYRCKLDGGGECEQMDVNLENDGSYPIWAKNNNSEQGLGFSVASDGQNVVVCAPQWFAALSKFNIMNYNPVGMCFGATSPAYQFKGFSPPFDTQNAQSLTYLTTGSCQFGLSAAHMKSTNTFAFGGPGCWTWEGDAWQVGVSYWSDGQVEASRFLGKSPKDDTGKDLPERFDYSYMGYSVATLRFGNEDAIVSSIPRNADGRFRNLNELYGANLLILTQSPNDQTALRVTYRIYPSRQISDNVIFTYYGYSLATLDMNGDGLDDLVVSAPFYKSSESEKGAIFVYTQTVSEDPTHGEVYKMIEEDGAPQRTGRGTFSRFGSSLANVGDLDGDGYEDLAVGAPFMPTDSLDGSGAVYIYMGSSRGLEKEPIQIIHAASNHFGFGSSIAQELPSIEGQGYDLAVGAYRSDAVVIFRSKEIVEVEWSLTLSGPIDQNNQECPCDHKPPSCDCVGVTYCLNYNKKIAKYVTNNELEFVTILSSSSDDLTFENGKTQIQDKFTGQQNKNTCKTLMIFTPTNIEEVKSYTIKGGVSLSGDRTNVIIDRRSILTKSEQLSVDVSNYQSDIILQYDILDEYVLKSQQPMKINFKINNQGDTAYESKLNIRSATTSFIITHDIESDNITCDTNADKEIECMLGKFNHDAEIDFNLNLRPAGDFFDSLDTHASFFDMMAEVKTLSALTNPDSAMQSFKAPIIVNGSLQLNKVASESNLVYFNSSDYYKSPSEANTEEQLGPVIKHAYRITNANEYSIYKAQLTVQWPHTIRDKPFLYLSESLSFDDKNHDCYYPSDVLDPFNLTTSEQTIQQQQQQQQQQQHYVKEGSAAVSMRLGSNSPQYVDIICSLGRISPRSEITVSLRGRLVLKTIVELEVGTAVKDVVTLLEVEITKMPLDYPPPSPSSANISTTISYARESPGAKVPVWWIVGSVLGGLLLLAVITVILWKCGFFKRRRTKTPDQVNETRDDEDDKQEEEQQLKDDNNPHEVNDGDDVTTPTEHLMQQTECAGEEFVFHKNE